MGPVSQRTSVGDSAGGLQRQWRCVELLHPRSRPFPGVPLGRGRNPLHRHTPSAVSCDPKTICVLGCGAGGRLRRASRLPSDVDPRLDQRHARTGGHRLRLTAARCWDETDRTHGSRWLRFRRSREECATRREAPGTPDVEADTARGDGGQPTRCAAGRPRAGGQGGQDRAVDGTLPFPSVYRGATARAARWSWDGATVAFGSSSAPRRGSSIACPDWRPRAHR